MMQRRDFGKEIDVISERINELQHQIGVLLAGKQAKTGLAQEPEKNADGGEQLADGDAGGSLYYAGTFRSGAGRLRWEPQERSVGRLLDADGDKPAKILSALGHKQRLDLLRAVLEQPQTGSELVDRLGMGTTGQLYHHIKALLGADLLRQEERGGAYAVPAHRTLPLLMLLAAASDLLDTTDYMEMADTRTNAEAYLGQTEGKYDPHLLVWAMLENSILEHRAGFCSEVNIFVQDHRRVTISDNGRGIPTRAFGESGKTWVHTVMTDLNELAVRGAVFSAPGSEKGISAAVVNALSLELEVEVRRDGLISRQTYRHGIPQGGLTHVGVTAETGTSITMEPEPELFGDAGFDADKITNYAEDVNKDYPGLNVRVHA